MRIGSKIRSTLKTRRSEIDSIGIALELWYSSAWMASSGSAPIPEITSGENERLHRFASTTVHHLREPVRTIRLYGEILAKSADKGGLSPEQRQCMEFLRKASTQMESLLDGLGEFTAASAPPSREYSRLRLDLPLRQALRQLDEQLKAAGGTVTYSELPAVAGDFDGLCMLFRHLIRNAVQYRDEAPPAIEVTATRIGNNDYDEWLVAVRDNGPGIPAEFREKVFEPYRRLHGKNLPGNGLGLSICRMIVENHGGRMWAEENRPNGAALLFTLRQPPDAS